jgi:hypothetical protein
MLYALCLMLDVLCIMCYVLYTLCLILCTLYNRVRRQIRVNGTIILRGGVRLLGPLLRVSGAARQKITERLRLCLVGGALRTHTITIWHGMVCANGRVLRARSGVYLALAALAVEQLLPHDDRLRPPQSSSQSRVAPQLEQELMCSNRRRQVLWQLR